MTEKELASEIADRLKISVQKAEQVVKLMKYAVETARPTTELTTMGRKVLVEFVPGVPDA